MERQAMNIFVVATFPTLVAWSVVLLVFHVLLQAHLSNRDRGPEFNAGPRDSERKLKSPLAGRADRASKNFRETYPAFVGLALSLAIMAPNSAWGHAGALLWFVARIVYIPLYLWGIPYIRSAVWSVAMLGLLGMFLAILV
jgi:uncharacterized MAPEG superfamily protein